MSEESVFARIFSDLGAAHQTMSATAQLLMQNGEDLRRLADKSQDLERFSRSYSERAEQVTAGASCCAIGILCFIFSATVGIIIVSFLSA
jgi:hypothetical protein